MEHVGKKLQGSYVIQCGVEACCWPPSKAFSRGLTKSDLGQHPRWKQDGPKCRNGRRVKTLAKKSPTRDGLHNLPSVGWRQRAVQTDGAPPPAPGTPPPTQHPVLGSSCSFCTFSMTAITRSLWANGAAFSALSRCLPVQWSSARCTGRGRGGEGQERRGSWGVEGEPKVQIQLPGLELKKKQGVQQFHCIIGWAK